MNISKINEKKIIIINKIKINNKNKNIIKIKNT
jgi:hypothetical protein